MLTVELQKSVVVGKIHKTQCVLGDVPVLGRCFIGCACEIVDERKTRTFYLRINGVGEQNKENGEDSIKK
jgi:hypothetical protein